MNRMSSWVVGLFLLLLVGCSGSSSSEASVKAEINYPEIALCDKGYVEGDTTVWQNFQIRNNSPTTLILESLELRGDSSCAFKIYREALSDETGMQLIPEESPNSAPLNMGIPYGHSTLLRVEYTPAAEGEMEYAALVINSNAQIETLSAYTEYIDAGPEEGTVESTVVVPLCGLATLPESHSDGKSKKGIPYDCPAPDPYYLQADTVCGDPIPENSPGCTP